MPGTRRTRLLALAACLSVAMAGALTTAGTAAAGEAPAPRAPGCDIPAQPPGDTPADTSTPQQPGTSVDRIVRSGGLDRAVRLHLPDGYTADRAWPVVLVFHGRGNSGPTTEGFTELSALPAILAYPDGVVGGDDRLAWQGAPYSAPGVDDVAFTGDLLDELESTLCVDTKRVYATGKSNGGGFTEILACRLADRIAAFAPVAGAYYRAGEPPCEPGRAVPVLSLHGTGDTTIPYTGDAGRGLPAIPDWVAGWAERNSCAPQPATRRIEPDITVSTWSGCDARAQVEHVAIDGAGHTWPGATLYSGGGSTTYTVRATDLIWEFFSKHHLR